MCVGSSLANCLIVAYLTAVPAPVNTHALRFLSVCLTASVCVRVRVCLSVSLSLSLSLSFSLSGTGTRLAQHHVRALGDHMAVSDRLSAHGLGCTDGVRRAAASER